jgi:deoxycytidylate deaminase
VLVGYDDMMRYIDDNSELEKAMNFFALAQDIAKDSLCKNAKCGAVVSCGDEYVSRASNGPPGGRVECSWCDQKDIRGTPTDKTCCVHAEDRAVKTALVSRGEVRDRQLYLPSSKLYFMRVSDKGDMTFANDPYCTICSKSVLDVGISEIFLSHEEGIVAYQTPFYNDLSMTFGGAKKTSRWGPYSAFRNYRRAKLELSKITEWKK